MNTIKRSKTRKPKKNPGVEFGDGEAGSVPALAGVTVAHYRSVSGARGNVVDDETGTPLGGVVVRWVSYGAKPSRRSKPVELGRALTAADGSFTIKPTQSNTAQEALCRLKHRPNQKTWLLVDDAARDEATLRILVDPTSPEITLRAGEHAEPPEREAWQVLSSFLLTNRMLRASDLTRELSAPSPDSPTRFWPLSIRAGGLHAAGAALADDGVTPALLDTDHFLDFNALQSGDLATALKKFRDGVEIDDHIDFDHRIDIDDLIGPSLHVPTSDLELYRDYLRGVWVTAAQSMYDSRREIVQPPAESVLVQQLYSRFHQNFRTSDLDRVPTTSLLMPVVRAALLGDKTSDGFGLAVGAIPAQDSQTDEDYLASLISLTGVSATELRNRYRLDFDRTPGDATSPVELNTEALLGLLTDTWQSPEEPFPANPQLESRIEEDYAPLPLIFPDYLGRAPFFLEFREWLARQRRFYPENIYDIRRNIPVFGESSHTGVEAFTTDAAAVENQPNQMDYFPTLADRQASATWLVGVMTIPGLVRDALKSADLRDLPQSLLRLEAAASKIFDVLHDSRVEDEWLHDRFDWWRIDSGGDGYWVTNDRVDLEYRAKRRVRTPADLSSFEAWFKPALPPARGRGNFPGSDLWDMELEWLARLRTAALWWLRYARGVLIPYFRAQVFIAQENWSDAAKTLANLTGYHVGIAETTSTPGYPENSSGTNDLFYAGATLPYTVEVGFDAEKRYADIAPPIAIAPFEQRFFKLAQGDVMLEWADQLYRSDDPASIRRARELFKGVLFMHGEDPGIAPHFKRADSEWSRFPHHQFGIGWGPTTMLPAALAAIQGNPARASQVQRARLALWQIEEGLNAYGYREDMVPILRYRPLKQAADLFATAAKSVQSDFIGYLMHFEQARIETWQTAAMVKRAEASAGIAREQIEFAKADVAKADAQVAQVHAQIAAKEAEIADHDSLFGQFSDFFVGIKDSVAGMVPLVEKVMKDDSPAGVATADDLKNILGKGLSGSAAAKDAAVAALGSGAGLAIGFGAFAYIGYSTMSAMADAANKRHTDLKALLESALPAAQAHVRLIQREVTIADYKNDIAQTDLDLARTLARFQQDRFLNVDLWNKLVGCAHRLLRRYIELAARTTWLAERALAYEQFRNLDVIRLNYFPSALRGITGADQLLFDLAQLEAQRLQGIRLTAPIKHTISLARDFPLQFGILKKTGRITFHTDAAALRAAYLGTSAYRIRAVTVAAQQNGGPAPRGMLGNLGVSTLSADTSAVARVLTRFPDALPLSEFRLHDDLFVYGLPGETLMQFEGSGFDTDWEIALPPAANPQGLAPLSDVLITFDMNADYSRSAAPAAGPVTVNGAVMVSARVFDPAGLASLRTAGAARIRFDMGEVPLRRQEKNRTITNLGVLLIGKTDKVFPARLAASLSATQAAFDIVDGFAVSNIGALLGTRAPLPLNVFAGLAVDQILTLEFDTAGVTDELQALFDVVLYVEYDAEL